MLQADALRAGLDRYNYSNPAFNLGSRDEVAPQHHSGVPDAKGQITPAAFWEM